MLAPRSKKFWRKDEGRRLSHESYSHHPGKAAFLGEINGLSCTCDPRSYLPSPSFCLSTQGPQYSFSLPRRAACTWAQSRFLLSQKGSPEEPVGSREFRTYPTVTTMHTSSTGSLGCPHACLCHSETCWFLFQNSVYSCTREGWPWPNRHFHTKKILGPGRYSKSWSTCFAGNVQGFVPSFVLGETT